MPAASPASPTPAPPYPHRYRDILRQTQQAFCLVEQLASALLDYRFLEVNAAFMAQTGLADPVGFTMRQLEPRTEAYWFALVEQVARTRQPQHAEHLARFLNERWYEVYALPSGPAGGRQVAILFTDVTARKRAEANLVFLADFSQELAQLPPGDELTAALEARICAHFRASQRHFGFVAGAPPRPLAAPGAPARAAPRRPTPPRLAGFRSPKLVRALRAGRLCAVEDTAHDARVNAPRLAALGYGALVAVPLLREGAWLCTLCVYAAAPREWPAAEQELLGELTTRIWAQLERGRAQQDLAASEKRYRLLFEALDQGVSTIEMVFDEQQRAVDFRYLEQNLALTTLAGLTRAVNGTLATTVLPYLEPFWLETYGRVATTGETARFEFSSQDLDNRWFDVVASRVGGADSRQVVVVYANITIRKRHEANLAFLAEVTEDLVGLANLGNALDALGPKMRGYFRATQCAFAAVDDQQRATVSHEWKPDQAPSFEEAYQLADYETADYQASIRAGTPCRLGNTATDPRLPTRQLAAAGIGAFLSVPLLRDGTWCFSLSLYDAAPREWRDDELALLSELTTRIWARLVRVRAKEALRQSEAQVRSLLALTTDMVYQMSADWRQLLYLTGLTASTFLADTTVPQATWFETYIPLADRGAVGAAIEAAIAECRLFELEHRVLRADGSVGWTFSRAEPLFDADGLAGGGYRCNAAPAG